MPPVTTSAPVPTDEIYDRYLKKAIAEINELGHEIERAAARKRAVPVLGSGHPLGDIMLLKYSPRPAEVQEAQRTVLVDGEDEAQPAVGQVELTVVLTPLDQAGHPGFVPAPSHSSDHDQRCSPVGTRYSASVSGPQLAVPSPRCA